MRTKIYICFQEEKIGGLSSSSSCGLKAEDFIDLFDFVSGQGFYTGR